MTHSPFWLTGLRKRADFPIIGPRLRSLCRRVDCRLPGPAIDVARDGEGARKLITVNVRRAPTMLDARRIAQP
jgi:N-acetylglutamate synthase/N-acetylornithine aminotransferase